MSFEDKEQRRDKWRQKKDSKKKHKNFSVRRLDDPGDFNYFVVEPEYERDLDRKKGV